MYDDIDPREAYSWIDRVMAWDDAHDQTLEDYQTCADEGPSSVARPADPDSTLP